MGLWHSAHAERYAAQTQWEIYEIVMGKLSLVRVKAQYFTCRNAKENLKGFEPSRFEHEQLVFCIRWMRGVRAMQTSVCVCSVIRNFLQERMHGWCERAKCVIISYFVRRGSNEATSSLNGNGQYTANVAYLRDEWTDDGDDTFE